MAIEREAAKSEIERRYGTAAAVEWQRLLRHFMLIEGFALLVVLVPDRDGADICRQGLDEVLARANRRLLRLVPADPTELRSVLGTLPDRDIATELGGIWIEAVVPRSVSNYEEWEVGWRAGLAGLNQQRNPLRRKFAVPLVLVGAPWLPEIFRTVAPDLWSIRSLVARIEPSGEPAELRVRSPEQEQSVPQLPVESEGLVSDPHFALREAERFRGQEGKELDLIKLLQRAGEGFFAQRDLPAAERAFREVVELRERIKDTPTNLGIALHWLAMIILREGRAAEAEPLFRRAFALGEQGGDTPTSLGITQDELARAIREQGRAAEAEAMFRQALALKEQGGAPPTSRGITQDELARAIREQGRVAEAEAMFRQAVALKEQSGDTPTSLGITLHELARTIGEQGRAAEAEAMFRQALALEEQGGAPPTSRGITLHELARAIREQGRAAEAEAMFRQALALEEQGGAPPTSRGITLQELALTIREQAEKRTLLSRVRRFLGVLAKKILPQKTRA